MLTALALVLLSTVAPPVPADAPQQAMFELRIFEARVPRDAGPEVQARNLGEYETFELDMTLMKLESDPELQADLLGMEGVRKARIVSAPRIVCQSGEMATIESGVKLEAEGGRAQLRADVRFEAAGPGLHLLEIAVDRGGEVLRGDFRMKAGESVLLSHSDRGRLLAAVITFRPLVKQEP
jgi:hypothetical protein